MAEPTRSAPDRGPDPDHARASGPDADRFADIDRLAAGLIAAALAGHPIADIRPGRRDAKNSDHLTLTAITDHDRHVLGRSFDLSAQQARGAWFLPEHASLKAATMNLPAYLRRHPWHAITLAKEDIARVHLASTPDALAAWALLIPLFDALMAPITHRAAGSAQQPDQQHAAWTEIVERYRYFGLDAEPALTVFTYGGGWSDLDRTGQLRARTALLDTLAGHDLLRAAARFRAERIQALVDATTKKARRGTPLARQVLTKALQPVLAAYFGGDWLAFLDYLKLAPNPNEEVVTALPAPKLYAGGSAKAAVVAAEQGMAVEDVHAMLAAFLGQSTSASPVEQRVEVLHRWWAQFDTIHARQTATMPALWGLVEDGAYTINPGLGPTPRLYRQLLSADLVTDVNRLWDGITLPRWPTTIVSEPYPHKLMAETLGAAVTFWHGVALTAWYVCEGPYSRTTLPGLRSYHERDLAALTEAGTPIHLSLFDELEHAEQYLGPPHDLETHVHEVDIPGGRIGIRVSGGGQRRDGFPILRDIITRHRQGWTRRYFQDYLHHRWHTELTTVARELHRVIAAKGKAPTFRQFARFAAPAANHWFNGDLASLYTAIGEKAPATPRRIDLLPIDAHDFVDAVYAALGGKPYDEHLRITDLRAADRYWQQAKLAAASVYYLQIAEALGRPPEPSEFNAQRYEWDWAETFEKGWPLFQHAIEHARSTERP